MKVTKLVLALMASMAAGHMATAQEVFDTYIAAIGHEDLYNSSGVRLKTAGAILQQDRANYHKFKIRHPSDTGDNYFTTPSERAKFSEAVKQSNLPKSLTEAIVMGTVRTLRIEIWGYDESGVDYFKITPGDW